MREQLIIKNGKGRWLTRVRFHVVHWLSTRHCPTSYSFYNLYKWLHRHWDNTSHEILWRFCKRRSFQLRFCSFCWSWKVLQLEQDLNVKKTKEMLTDWRKNPTVIPDLFVDDVKVERVEKIRSSTTTWILTKTDFIHKKCQPRIFCLHKLRSLNVNAAVSRISTGVVLNQFSDFRAKQKCPD